jgi:hypothetical protein
VSHVRKWIKGRISPVSLANQNHAMRMGDRVVFWPVGKISLHSNSTREMKTGSGEKEIENQPFKGLECKTGLRKFVVENYLA